MGPGAGSLVRVLLATLCLVAGCSTAPAVDTKPPGNSKEVDASENTGQADVTPERVAEPTPDARRITVAAVGDMMLGTDYPENHLPDDDGISFLAGVSDLLRGADVTFGNLEGVLADGGEPVKQCSSKSACYLFRSPARYAQHFADAGFDLLSVANNHARDFGEQGRTATMEAVASAGMLYSGRRGDFATFTQNGLRVAFLAYAVTRNSNLMHDYDYAARTVESFALDHDIVIVSFHGGAEGRDVTRLPFAEEEYYGEPRGDVVRFARLMVDSGADLVLGHGPHVVRAMERYRDRLIAYSLGNFATYYGISVDGLNGVAPILVAELDAEGRFLHGHIHSTVQIRPGGPQPDTGQYALSLLRDLSVADFGDPGLEFHDDGRLARSERAYTRPWPPDETAPGEH